MDGNRRIAQMLKALAHPIRLTILEVLDTEGEACVCHLERRLGQRQAYISQQLSTLREAGLVTDRREGLNIFYALADGGIPNLIRRAKRLGVQMARRDGLHLEFPAVAQVEPDRCNCPKCEQKVAAAMGSR